MTAEPKTPIILQSMLKASGRPVTLRALEDWRRKQLLPGLVSKGRGRRGGKIWYWKQQDIFERACIVADLMRRRPDNNVFLALWLCGFDVPQAKVRTVWLKNLKRAQLHRKTESFAADKYTDEIETLEKSLKKEGKLKISTIEALAREFIVAIQEMPDVPSPLEEMEELIEAVRQTLLSEKLPSKALPSFGPKTFREWQILIRTFISLKARSALIRKATPQQFKQAQDYLKALGSFLHRLLSAKDGAPPQEQVLQYRASFAWAFGGVIFRIFLSLLVAGEGARLRRTAQLAKFQFAALGGPVGLQPQLVPPSNLDFMKELFNIWNDLELKRIYKIYRSR